MKLTEEENDALRSLNDQKLALRYALGDILRETREFWESKRAKYKLPAEAILHVDHNTRKITMVKE